MTSEAETGLKFRNAKFFNVNSGKWVTISPQEFNYDLHHGRIECPDMSCHAALLFISGGLTDGSRKNRPDHFRAKGGGKPHNDRCSYQPDKSTGKKQRIKEALEDEKYVLININFCTSFKREKGYLKDSFAQAAMKRWGGWLRREWIAEHGKKNDRQRIYESFSGKSLEKLTQHARAFRLAKQELGIKSSERLVVSYLHGVLPWTSFCIWNNAKNARSQRQLADVNYLVQKLLEEDGHALPGLERLWAPTPVLRMDISGKKTARKTEKGRWRIDFGRAGNLTRLNGQDHEVLDVVLCGNESILTSILEAEKVSLVATPYVWRDGLRQAARSTSAPVYLNWPVVSMDQLILK